ncbi:cysteine/serine-rich nuclear protein 2-like [Anabas testudineus]|uniref:Cysteine/serine-rich nuclear protein N-terminal domain-containing protein n=1 Tax=Anabas testudineus TaxID=64144 RepID=A0A3Q1HME9_ANATE|nr:cysteine/serine-rich nuclear protein 2-like [Anabas testudineus]
MYINHQSQTMRVILKRKFAEVDDDPCYSSSSPPSSLSSPASSGWESDGESSSSGNQDFSPHSPSLPTILPIQSILKKPKLKGAQSNVRFDQVTVFSFPRCQGFTSVPRRGGATLGMVQRHSAIQRYTVAEHALEQQHRRRVRLQERLREERFKAFKYKLITSGAIDQQEADRLTVDQVPNEDGAIHISDVEVEDGGLFKPYSSKQRQALLQAAGVKRIDREEKRQLHALRLSREACGCNCQGFCEPETCACSLAGIKCQMDRLSFPCGCSKDGCGNTQGRVEFDSRRVQTHYIHTIMRLGLEGQLQAKALSLEDETELPEDLVEFDNQDQSLEVQKGQDKSCPFGFTLEEDCSSLTMPVSPSFHFIPERLVVEENSCSSDMTDSSSTSSDSDTGACANGGQNLLNFDRGLSCSLSICASENDNCSMCSQVRHIGDPVMQHSTATRSTTTDSVGPLTANTFTDNISRTSLTDCLDENANQTRDFFDNDSLEDFPATPSPTVDYSVGTYMDLSLSSDSDLEFFDSDYPSGPLHSSFKGHRHPDRFHNIQLFSSVSLPQYESSAYLLESLIGITEPSPE